MDSDEKISLVQKKLFRGKRSYTIIGDKIEYSSKKMFYLNTFSIPLRDINPQPTRYRNFPLGWFVMFIIVLLVDALFIWSMYSMCVEAKLNKNESIDITSLMFVIFSVFTYFVTKRTFKKWGNVWTFNSSMGYIAIWANKPNTKKVEEFVANLSEKIKQNQNGIDNREEVFLDFLMNQGLIDEWNYDKAKKLLEGSNG
jgi:hypothetical protein